MKNSKFKLLKIVSALAIGFMTYTNAHTEGRLVVYCSATNAMCENAVKMFGKKHDVKTSFIRNGSGSTFAKIKAEEKNRRIKLNKGKLYLAVSSLHSFGC